MPAAEILTHAPAKAVAPDRTGGFLGDRQTNPPETAVLARQAKDDRQAPVRPASLLIGAEEITPLPDMIIPREALIPHGGKIAFHRFGPA